MSSDLERRRRWWRAAVVAAILIVALVVVAGEINLNEYAISPGQAQPVAPLIHVPAARSHAVHGAILLTDVYVQQVSLLDLVPDLLSSDDQLVPADQLLGPYTPPAQLDAQGYLEMAQAQAGAKAAALRWLGYNVPEHDAGVVVFAVSPGSPAAAAGLQVAQVVTAVGSTPTPTVCSLVAALAGDRPGTRVDLTVEQSTVTSNGVQEPGRSVLRTARLARRPKGDSGVSDCPGVPASKGYLGVEIETQQDFTLPFPISIDTSDIGGPSAGLAMTLGIIDRLTNGRLTGGRTIAATGTIAANGAVGAVGGVAQKTIAVERAGATAFLVPPGSQGYQAALSKRTPSLKVFAVSTLAQAMSVIKRLGGDVGASTSSTAPSS